MCTVLCILLYNYTFIILNIGKYLPTIVGSKNKLKYNISSILGINL